MKRYIHVVFTFVIFCSCSKSWIEVKPDKALVVPTHLEDLQALLDNYGIMNNQEPELGALGCDDYFLAPSRISTLGKYQKNAYIWASEIFDGRTSNDWVRAYKQIEYANLALAGIEKISYEAGNMKEWQNVKGAALFFRSWAYFGLTQLFMKPYDESTSNLDAGVPLRLTPSLEARSARATVKEVYDRIIQDITLATALLPAIPTISTVYRPTKQAAHGLLARVYLLSSNYDSALVHASECLKLYDTLVDLNNLPASLVFNPEVIFMSGIPTPNGLRYAQINSDLFDSYDPDDLRRTVFFNYNSTTGMATFKGSYKSSANTSTFNGLATDEMYLIKAECYARKGKIIEAADDLNTLLRKRYKSDFFIDIMASTGQEMLKITLDHRRKELVLRGLRWSDLRRLNKEGADIILTRSADNQVYTLLPNDVRYVYPIPPDEILLSGLEQNER